MSLEGLIEKLQSVAWADTRIEIRAIPRAPVGGLSSSEPRLIESFKAVDLIALLKRRTFDELWRQFEEEEEKQELEDAATKAAIGAIASANLKPLPDEEESRPNISAESNAIEEVNARRADLDMPPLDAEEEELYLAAVQRAQAYANGSTEPDPADQIHPNNPANRVD